MASHPSTNTVFAIVALYGVGILAGCGSASQSYKTPTPPGPAPTAGAALSASPTSLSFVNVLVGKVGSQVVSVTNTGNANATISSVSTSGAGFSVDGMSSGMILEPDQVASLTVSFSPTALGSATGTATITSDAADSPATVTLSGFGTSSTSPDLTPPDCGLSNDTTNHIPAASAWTNFTPPALGSTYTDSVYGCAVKRLTNSIAFGQAQHHYYATIEPMSAGDTKILVYDEDGFFHIIDLDGNVVVTEANMPATNGLVLWDRSDDNVFWQAQKDTLQKCTVSGSTTSCVTNHTFTEYSGYVVNFMDSTDMTPDGWLPMVGQNIQGEHIDVFLWNPATLTKSAAYTTTCTADARTANNSCLHKLISTPNDGIIVEFTTDGPGLEQGNRLWESPWTTPLPYVQNLTGHLDSGRDLSGNEVYATEDPLDHPGPFGTCVNGFRPTLLIVGATTPDGPSCMFDAPLNPGWHVSYRDWPLSAWIAFSAQGDNAAERFNNDPSYIAPSAITWSTYDNEVVLVRVDVNNNPTYIYRLTLAHTRNVNSNSYWSDPHAVLSFDGKYIVFDSNAAWDATGCGSFTDCADLYLIKIH
jgi:hypothetical protein